MENMRWDKEIAAKYIPRLIETLRLALDLKPASRKGTSPALVKDTTRPVCPPGLAPVPGSAHRGAGFQLTDL